MCVPILGGANIQNLAYFIFIYQYSRPILYEFDMKKVKLYSYISNEI